MRITIIAKKPYNLSGRTGISYGGYAENGKYILFTSPNSEDYEIFPEARAGKKFDPKRFVDVELYEWFDMFSGRTKWKDVPDPREND